MRGLTTESLRLFSWPSDLGSALVCGMANHSKVISARLNMRNQFSGCAYVHNYVLVTLGMSIRAHAQELRHN